MHRIGFDPSLVPCPKVKITPADQMNAQLLGTLTHWNEEAQKLHARYVAAVRETPEREELTGGGNLFDQTTQLGFDLANIIGNSNGKLKLCHFANATTLLRIMGGSMEILRMDASGQ
jgi:hypothetical protein